jgi:glycosyltransferase involved in cell wall biosynthesis
MARSLRIAWIGSRGVPARCALGGGIERAVEELGGRLAARGHDLTVYCRSYYTRDGGDYHGMHRVVLPTVKSKHLDTIVHAALASLHALGRRYDVVQYFAFGPSLLAWTPRLTGARAVASVRTLEWQREKWGLLARAVLALGERASIHCPHATSTVSAPAKAYLEGKYGRTVVHIPNGVAAPVVRAPQAIVELGLVPGEYLLFVGRLVPEKGCHELVQAFATVRTGKALVVAGAPSYSEAYAAGLRRAADARVRFLGHVAGPPLEELYAHAAAVVLPSHVEGLSNALLEAMSYGRCVVVSDIAENLVVVEDDAVIVPRGDVAALAAALQRVCDDPELADGLGKRAAQRALTRYSWDAVADATEALYRSLVDGPAGEPEPAATW